MHLLVPYLVQDFQQLNAVYGCGTCYAKGTSVAIGKGHMMAFPFDVTTRIKHAQLRTMVSTVYDVKEVLRSGKPCNGVKGISVLTLLPYVDITRQVDIDYMHCCI